MLLEGALKVPSVDEMQTDIARLDKFMKEPTWENHYQLSVGGLEIWLTRLATLLIIAVGAF